MSNKHRKIKNFVDNNSKTICTNSQMRNGRINFRLQLGRDQIEGSGLSFYNGRAHEERFKYLSRPCRVHSSYHTPNSPDFSKTKGRDNRGIFCKNMVLVDYSPHTSSYLSSIHCNRIV